MKELKDFRRITLQPGETRRVEFEITPDTLSFYNEEMKWVVEPGAFTVMVGTDSIRTENVTLTVA